MIYISTFLYYTIFSSAVLFYGIGINKISVIGEEKRNQIIFYTKTVLTIFSTAILTYLVVQFMLVPLSLIEIFPLVCLLIFVAINSFAEGLVRLTTGTSSTEFIISFMIALLSVFESTSILDVLIICTSCMAGLLILIPFVLVFRKRIMQNGQKFHEKYICLFFVFLAVLILLISAFDISWLNGGMLK